MKGIVCVANTFVHENSTWKKKLLMLFMFLLVSQLRQDNTQCKASQ